MKIHLCVVGRLRRGPELELIDDYLDRFNKTGRNMGLGPTQVIEVEDKKGGGMAAEANLLRRVIPQNALTMVMDERGKVIKSPEFAAKIGDWRDAGQRDLAILLGGADGLSPELRAEADFALSFGKMVWPHMLARVMLCEQLYRAASILAGSPYHRA